MFGFVQDYFKNCGEPFSETVELLFNEAQSAFVPERLITHNILLTYEILEDFNQKRYRKKGHLSLKLDVSKAYDRVEWDFLRKMLLKMGIVERWVNFIHYCVNTIMYSIMLNDVVGNKLSPERKLRQSDLLSPYLFLICSEGLSLLMCLASQRGLVKRERISMGGLEISHLLFVNDCILFGGAMVGEAMILK